MAEEYNRAEMILLYNPSAEHRCKLPKIKVYNYERRIEPRTIMECDQCAQRWWADIDVTNYERNGWRKLRWYQWVLRGKIA